MENFHLLLTYTKENNIPLTITDVWYGECPLMWAIKKYNIN